MKQFIHYFNGQWVEASELKISIFDLAFCRGYGLFDYLKTYNRHPFYLDAHLKRLENSARILEIPLPKSLSEIDVLVREGIEKNPGDEVSIKIIVTGGESTDSVTRGVPSLLIVFGEIPSTRSDIYSTGAKIMSSQTNRTLPLAKSLSYLEGIIFLNRAKVQNAVEVVYYGADTIITECVRSNIFFVKNKTLFTPSKNMLSGITRQVVIELAEKNGIACEFKDISIDTVGEYDECFITGSGIEIVPIVQIEKTTIGNGTVGVLTNRVMEIFKSFTATY